MFSPNKSKTLSEKDRVALNEERTLSQHQELSKIGQVAAYTYSKGDELHQAYADFFAHTKSVFDNLTAYGPSEVDKVIPKFNAAKEKAKKEADLAQGTEAFLKKKTDDLTMKNKHMGDIRSKIKEGLGNLEIPKLTKLKVEGKPQLDNFFATLFKVFYKETKGTYNWKEFKSKVIKADKGEDFINRLVNVDFAALNEEERTSLNNLAEDEFIKNFLTNDKEGATILELVNYLVFIPEGVKTQHDIDELVHEINKVKSEAPQREAEGKFQQHYADTLMKNIAHLEDLNNRIFKSAETLTSEVHRENELVDLYEKHKKNLRDLVYPEFARVKNVPETVYRR